MLMQKFCRTCRREVTGQRGLRCERCRKREQRGVPEVESLLGLSRCVGCQRVFTTSSPRVRYCGDDCRRGARRRRASERRAAARAI